MSRLASAPATITIRRAICWSSSGSHGDEDPAHVSGGEARRAALARVLAPSPDILLLDEPTNHLDLPTIEWLEGELESRRCALVIISHDRRFLSNLSRATAWLDRGQIRQIDRGFSRVRSLARRGAGGRRARPAQARPQDRQRGALAALRRLRPPQAQRQAARQSACAARPAARLIVAPTGNANLAAAEADKSGKLVIEAKNIGQGLWRPHDRRGLLDPRPARRPHRHRRPERRRQDHADRDADRRQPARQRHDPARRQYRDGDARPAPRKPRPQIDAGRSADRRTAATMSWSAASRSTSSAT